MYRAIPCNCGHRACKHWHVSIVADQHGVSFTKKQAEDVANLLNGQKEPPKQNHFLITKRDEIVIELRKRGTTYKEIGILIGSVKDANKPISQSRVRDIISRKVRTINSKKDYSFERLVCKLTGMTVKSTPGKYFHHCNCNKGECIA